MADVWQVVAAPRRREILRLVWDAELSAGDIAAHFDVTWPAISQHLKLLREAGAVTERREGTRRLYRADQATLGPIGAFLSSTWQADLDRLRDLAERDERANSGP